MKVFFSFRHERHAPQWYAVDGTVRPYLDATWRVEAILEALRRKRRMELTADAPADPWPAIRAVHRADYLEYLRTIHGLWAKQFGAGDYVVPDTFVRAGTRRPREPLAQAGYYCFDTAAPIAQGTYEAAVEAARCAVAAADAVLAGQRAAYALCRPPGHHAGPDYCGGFCYLNNAAIAAQHLVMTGRSRVAILDIDYHHGNGTQDIFYARKDVLFVSVHAAPDAQYPYFWGYADETGAGDGAGFNVNLPLQRGATEALWLEAFEKALAHVQDYQPEALVVSLGVDTFESDDVGDFGLTRQAYPVIGKHLRALGLPTVVIQEGGYNVEAVGPCVAAVLSELSR